MHFLKKRRNGMQKVCVFGFLQALICPAGCLRRKQQKRAISCRFENAAGGWSGAERGNTFAGLRKVAVKAGEIGKRIVKITRGCHGGRRGRRKKKRRRGAEK